jgi:heat-inducible transcriptional repressor
MITALNERSRTIFKLIVDSYLMTGAPVGSRTISHNADISLSSASIRNTMADLEESGLLYAPHVSAGRLPTEKGLRLYIDGLMQSGELSTDERIKIESSFASKSGKSVGDLLEDASNLLSGLSACASLVITPKSAALVKQVQFVKLSAHRILAVLVLQNGLVENRLLETKQNIPAASLAQASNYLNDKLVGKNFKAAQRDIERDIKEHKTQLDQITQDLVKQGLALPETDIQNGRIIIKGQSRLLKNVKALEDLERARHLFAHLEQRQKMLQLLSKIEQADGVQIFIGTENPVFNQTGWSMIISPYKDREQKIVGAIGVIGPTRLDYDRIVPMVDYTSRVVERLIESL